jgi:hypothetical protein
MIEDNDPVHIDDHRNESEMSEAEIDKNLQDSFPASDPPSWSLGTDHKEPPAETESDENEPPRH